MRTLFIRLFIAVALAAGAWYARSEARAAERSAIATQQIVTLRYADVAPGADAARDATVDYWLGRYGSVKPDAGDSQQDAALLLMVANAAFREAERQITAAASPPTASRAGKEPSTGQQITQQLVQQLDGVLQAYASALKAAPRHVEAAYNYEYVARVRDQVARAQGKPLKAAPPAAASGGDLPAGATIHGRPGGPPPDAKMEDLQMLAPMEFGDREAQPEATPGGKRERKG
jgi:hypothetical protein